MPEVDPYDDTVDRLVVWHYRFDAARRERRNVAVAAFDNEREFEERVDHEISLLRERQAAGAAEAAEHITGSHLTAGHRQRMDAMRARPRATKARERKRGRS